MERTRRDSVCFNTSHDCESTLTRFVWAGDQLLWELRVPGSNEVVGSGLESTSASGDFYGRVSYFHAGGIDRPLLITKEGVESVVPRETWRGQFHKGTSPATGLVRDCAYGGQTGCLLIAWPGMQTNAAHSWGGEQPDIRVWYGGLVDGMRDASGQMYMRNRYYDPATGQFTQTDPIGLAGGLNAYGFAAGDPVSYSDPYGLRPDSVTFSSAALERTIRGTASRLPTMAETIEDMEGNPNLIVNFGEKDLNNPGQVDDPFVNERGQTVINVWFDFAEIQPLMAIPAVAQKGGVTVDDVVVHETYGHAQPLHEGWDCRDETGCARRRENFVRPEYGRPPRQF